LARSGSCETIDILLPSEVEPLRAIIISLFAAFISASSVHAQSVARSVTYDGIAFDDAKHRGWYIRFWNGSCAELRNVVCLSGSPHWNEIMERLLAAAPAARREQIQVRLILLGRKVGYEWAKENNIRRIDNGHIKRWTSDLKQSGDVEAAVARIEAQAGSLLGGTGDPIPSHARRY
jgi:hypothetical protein